MSFNPNDITVPNNSSSSSTTNNNNSQSTGVNSLVTGSGFIERNKKWQMELLMERLRSKSSQYKPLQDTSRNIRIAMLEKRYALDMVEKTNLQKCLDRMQYCIKVSTRQGLVERLESLSRQLGLKFSDDNLNLFISSDMFYLEIILDGNGKVHDVKVHHEFKMEQQSCQELVSCLLKGDFADFTAQLEGLTSIYQLNADKKTKSNAFVALQALESDLQILYSLQQNQKDPFALVQSTVGILQSRRGGHPMRLTYFVSPYQLLDIEKNILRPLTVDLIHAQNTLGLSVTVHLEAASSNKLQIASTIKIQKDTQGNVKPDYAPLTPENSILLPAYFVLRLNKPIAIGVNILRKIEQLTRTKFPDDLLSKTRPIMNLIAYHVSDGQILNTSKGLFVSLPDQMHCYFLTENIDLPGVIIKSIPFTEPSHVPQILRFLRQQALFNTLITSCIRTTNNKSDVDNKITFEINALSCQNISITLEHPHKESMATVELDLSGNPNIKCNIFSLGGNYNSITTELSKILQKCVSIPVTIRTLIKYWEREHANKERGVDDSNLSLFLSQSVDRKPININPASIGNGTIKNGDVIKAEGQQQQRQKDDSTSIESKGAKRRRPDDEYFQRNEYNPKDDTNRSQRNDLTSKDGVSSIAAAASKLIDQLTDPDPVKPSNLTSNLLKDNFRSSMGDDGKSGKSSKMNVDCDKPKLSKSDIYDSNGKRIDGSNFGEPMKKRQKRPRDEKSSDGNSNSSPSKTMSSTGMTSLSSSSGTNASGSSSLTSVLSGMDHWSQQQQQQQSMYRFDSVSLGKDMEILPISSQPQQNVKTCITITAINSASKNSSGAGASSDKRTGANNGNEHRLKLEKKKKRRREDSPMGPPEKMPFKSDQSSRPVTVSIKTSDGSSVRSPDGQQLLRKFSTSPVLQQSSKIALSSTSSKVSPKHSPHNPSSSHSSPKHQSLPSPKGNHYSTSSPKHSSSAGSGKPSMSTLKSATSSPNSKSKDRDREGRDREKDRDRYKYSSGSHSPKLKTKMSTFMPVEAILDASSSSQDSIKSSGSGQANKMRKGSLSAVIDKLKSARHVNEDSPPNTPTLTTPPQSLGSDTNLVSSTSSTTTINKEKTSMASSQQAINLANSSISITSLKNNSEYMVKPSSDGMKITINKTRTKDMTSPSSKQSYQHSGSGSSGSNSPKTHTGLKPGVNSGPASKKPQSSMQSSQLESSKDSSGSQKRDSSSASSSNTNQSSNQIGLSSLNSSSISKSSGQNSSSSSLSQKGSSASDSYKKDKNRNTSKSGNGPPPNRDVLKLLGLPGSATPSIDGFGKVWDAKYQIPKLSARSSANDKDTSTTTTSTVASSPLNTANQETSATKTMPNFMSNMHSFGNNQMLSNKIHGGRASSVSPKYNLNNDSMSSFNKDIHLYKSSSSDALQHQSQSSGHHMQMSGSGNNAFSSLLSNKSPLHHPTVNQPLKNLMSNAPPVQTTSTSNPTMGNLTSQNLMSFQEQMKKNRPTPKLNDFPSPSGSTLVNQNPMRNMAGGPVNSSAANVPANRRPITSPQQQFSNKLTSDKNGNENQTASMSSFDGSLFWA